MFGWHDTSAVARVYATRKAKKNAGTLGNIELTAAEWPDQKLSPSGGDFRAGLYRHRDVGMSPAPQGCRQSNQVCTTLVFPRLRHSNLRIETPALKLSIFD